MLMLRWNLYVKHNLKFQEKRYIHFFNGKNDNTSFFLKVGPNKRTLNVKRLGEGLFVFKKEYYTGLQCTQRRLLDTTQKRKT